MSLAKCFFVFVFAVLLISADRSKENALQQLKELKEIGTTENPKLLDKKAILSSDLSNYYQAISDNAQAKLYAVKAIDFTRKRIEIENNWNAQNLNDLSFLYRNLAALNANDGNIEAAKAAFKNAETYFLRERELLSFTEGQFEAADLYSNGFAWAYHANELELAERFILKAINSSKKGGSSKQLVELYRLHGELFSRKQDTDRAIELIDLSIQTHYESSPDSKLSNALIHSKISQHYKLKEYQEVISFLSSQDMFSSPKVLEDSIEANNFNDASGTISNAFILSFSYIRSYQTTKNSSELKQALEWQKMCYSLAEKTVLENGSNSLGDVIGLPYQKIISTLKNYELLNEEHLLSQEDLGQLMRILDIYQSTKLHLDRLNNELNSKIWQEQKELKSEFDQLIQDQEELKNDHPKKAKLDSLIEKSYTLALKIADLDNSTKRDQLIKEYKVGQANFIQLLDKFHTSSKKDIVTYFWAKPLGAVYIIGRSKKGYFLKTIKAPEALSKTIESSYKLNSKLNTNSEDINEQKRHNEVLYKLLIDPIKKEIRNNRNLLIYPFGEISYISFDALIQKNGRYLIEDYDISYTSSLFSILRTYKKNSHTGGTSSFYPKNYGTDSLNFLFHAQKEVDALEEQGNCESFTSEKATKKNFIKKANESKILHVSSHSILDLKNPYRSYLIFDAKKDTLYKMYAYEIFAESFDADLVTLSSCHSSSGAIESGIGVVSLSNAFYFSGIPATIGSLWSAQDHSSSEIMINFYGYMNEGLTKSKSLSKAKRDFLKEADKINRQPFFWANYVLYGNDEPIITSSNESTSNLWISIVIGLVLIGGFVSYKRFKSSRAVA